MGFYTRRQPGRIRSWSYGFFEFDIIIFLSIKIWITFIFIIEETETLSTKSVHLMAPLENRMIYRWKVNFYLPLRFRKAGRLWCGGAPETHWATCTMKWLIAKWNSLSDLPDFLGHYDSSIKKYGVNAFFKIKTLNGLKCFWEIFRISPAVDGCYHKWASVLAWHQKYNQTIIKVFGYTIESLLFNVKFLFNKKESQTAQRTSRLSHRQHTDENEPKQKINCSEIKILSIIIFLCQEIFWQTELSST